MTTNQAAVAAAFRKCFLWDATMTRPGSVADYQEMFPGHEQLIASEYAQISSSAHSAGADEKEAPVQRRFGPYRIERLLGRGGQATVYAATDSRDGSTVALKVFRADGSNRERRLQRLRREADATAQLAHPGICRFREAGLHEGVPYLAMHLVPGTSLAQRIAHARRTHPEALGTLEASAHLGLPGEGEPGVGRCVRYFELVARAIHTAHEAGLIHRDLKPGNLMVTPTGEPVILDFGLVRDEEEGATITQTGAVLGTIAYMAPEQIEESGPRLDRRVDVYALGVSLFEALTYLHPFQTATREAAIRASLMGDVKDLRDLDDRFPDDLAIVAATALRRHRDRRYESALALAEDLEAFRLGRRILARPPSATQRLGDWAKRHPALASSVAVAFVTLGTGLGVSLHLLGKEKQALAEKQDALVEKQDALVEKQDALVAVTRSRNESNDMVRFLVSDMEKALIEAGNLGLAEKVALRAKALFETNLQGELSVEELTTLADVFDQLSVAYQQQVGGHPAAKASSERAYEIREQLHREHPEDPLLAHNLAKSAGALARRAGTPPTTAIERYARALSLLESLPAPLSKDADVLSDRCYFGSGLAENQRRIGRLADAERTITATASLVEELRKADSENPERLIGTVYVQQTFAAVLEDLGRGVEAQSKFDAQLQLARSDAARREARGEKAPRITCLVGDMLQAVSDMAWSRGDWDTALAAADEGTKLLTALRATDTLNAAWSNRVASARDRLTHALIAVGRYDEAVAAARPAWEGAAAMGTRPASQIDGRGQREVAALYRTYGAALGRAGKTDAAVVELDEARRWLERSHATVPEDVHTQLATISCLQDRGLAFMVAAEAAKGRVPAEDSAVADWAGRALSAFDEADVVARSLLAEHPDYARAARSRAVVLSNTARARVLLGDTKGAAGALEEAIRVRDALAAADAGYVTRLRGLDQQLEETRLLAAAHAK